MKHQNFITPIAFALGMTVAGAATAETLTMGVRGGPESMDPHFSALGSHAEAAKPNIILVMPDDTGYGDYKCLGNPTMQTSPNCTSS